MVNEKDLADRIPATNCLANMATAPHQASSTLCVGCAENKTLPEPLQLAADSNPTAPCDTHQDEGVNLNKKIDEFLLGEGIDATFKVFAQLTAAATLFKLVKPIREEGIVWAIVTVLVSFLLLAVAVLYGINKFWIPLLNTVFGKDLRKFDYNKLSSYRRGAFIIYLIGAVAFSLLSFKWVGILAKL